MKTILLIVIAFSLSNTLMAQNQFVGKYQLYLKEYNSGKYFPGGNYLQLDLVSGKLYGVYKGSDNFGEHGNGYFKISITKIEILDSSKFKFKMPSYSYYEYPVSDTTDLENTIGGSNPFETYIVNLKNRDLYFKCISVEYECPDELLFFKRED